MSRYVLVGYDGSPGSAAALRFALEEARLRSLPLRIACAWKPPDSSYVGEAFAATPDAILEAEHHADEVLREALAELGAVSDVAVEALAAEGEPADVLATLAHEAVLLVVGSRGRGAARSLVLGSVGMALAAHAPCPLVIVRPHDG